MAEQLAGLITAFAIFLTSMVGIMGAYLLHTRQKPMTEADTADKYQQIADRAATRALRLEDRIDNLEKENYETNQKLKQVMIELATYKRWTERLVHQIRSLGQDPVKKELP